MSQLSSDYLIELAKSCILNANLVDVVRPHLNYSYLQHEVYKHIFKYIFDYHGANKKSPTIGLLSQNVNSREALETIGKIRDANVYGDQDEIVKTFETFVKQSRFVDLHKKTADLWTAGKNDEAMQLLEDESIAINAFSLRNKLHRRIFADFDKRQEERENRDYSTIKIATGIPPLDYHTRGGIDRGTGLLAIGKSGAGKAQPLYSRIYTPDGYTTMGEVKVGDYVLSENGNPIKVIGTFPQGLRKVYRIKFSDGVEVDCDENHLWKVYTAHDRKTLGFALYRKKTTTYNITIPVDKHSILSTVDMIGKERVRMCKGRENILNYKLPICKALQFIKKDLLIPPYTLGALIGDGGLTNTSINFSTIDKEILNRIGSELCIIPTHIDRCNYRLVGANLKKYISKIFGSKCHSGDKFIPKEYLYSNIDDRINLLRGLMDTDGYISKRGTDCVFYTSSVQLAKDIVELVNGLGGIALLKNRGKKKYTYNNEKRVSKYDSLAITINLPSEINPFYLKRKVKRVVSKTKYVTPRFIESIQYIGEIETKCILVDSPTHLYITDGCVVTHNTTFLRSLGYHAAFRGVNVLHFFGGDSTVEEVETGYDGMWTGVDLHQIKEGKLDGADIKKIEKAKQAFMSQCGEIYVHGFKQFHTASIADCRAVLIELLKECDIGLVLFDLLESFDPGDGKRYSTNQEGNSARKKATSEKIINIATEFNVAVATVTQASDIKKESWDNPNWVITRNDISNLKATIDPFAYCVTLNQTEGENDNEIMRIHEEKLRHYKIFSWSSTYHIAQKRDVGRFIDVAETNKRFWDVEKKQIMRDKPKEAKNEVVAKTA